MKALQSAIAIAAIALATTGCGQASSVSSGSDSTAVASMDATISNFEVNQTIKKVGRPYLCDGDTVFGAEHKVYTESTATIQWLTRFGDNDLTTLQDSLVSVAFKARGHNIDSVLTSYATHPKYMGTGTLKPVDRIENPDDYDHVCVMYANVNARIVELSENIIVYKVEFDEYSGGAHPSYAAQFINYDPRNNRTLAFDQIFRPESADSLLSFVKEKLCRQYYVESIDKLAEVSGIFVDQIFVSHNVFFSPQGLTFYYNPYDIGPWAIGSVEVKAYDYELKPFLTPEALAVFDALR